MSEKAYPREQTVFEVWQGGTAVAFAGSWKEALNYIHQLDGPAELVAAITVRQAFDMEALAAEAAKRSATHD